MTLIETMTPAEIEQCRESYRAELARWLRWADNLAPCGPGARCHQESRDVIKTDMERLRAAIEPDGTAISDAEATLAQAAMLYSQHVADGVPDEIWSALRRAALGLARADGSSLTVSEAEELIFCIGATWTEGKLEEDEVDRLRAAVDRVTAK